MSKFAKKGESNYIDLLDEDNSVAGQKFVCISFLSPEKILKDKNIYNFEKFLNQYDFSKSLEKFNQFLNFLSYKYKLDFEKLNKDLTEFVEEEKNNLYNISLADEYKTYIDNNEDKINEQFLKENEFQTFVRGVKIRGSYPSQQEAELRCKMLRELDPNHDVFVGPVGVWMPWDPEAYKTGKVEYLEDELNELMNEKNKNENFAKEQFEKRVKEAKRKAIEDNIEKAKNSGNTLTQTIDKNDNLVNLNNVNTFENEILENKDNETVTQEDIKKTLFEDENVVMDIKKSDHGLSDILKSQAEAEKAKKEAEKAKKEDEEAQSEEAKKEVINID